MVSVRLMDHGQIKGKLVRDLSTGYFPNSISFIQPVTWLVGIFLMLMWLTGDLGAENVAYILK